MVALLIDTYLSSFLSFLLLRSLPFQIKNHLNDLNEYFSTDRDTRIEVLGRAIATLPHDVLTLFLLFVFGIKIFEINTSHLAYIFELIIYY